MAGKRKFYSSKTQRKKETLEKIDMIFEEKKEKRISVKAEKNEKHKGKGNKIESYKTYANDCKKFVETEGILDLKEITPERIRNYIDKEIEKEKAGDGKAANRISKKLAALTSLQQGIQVSEKLSATQKKKVDFGNLQEQRNYVAEQNVHRSPKGSEYKIASNREVRTVRERLERKAKESNDPLDKIAYDYVRFAIITGSRSFNGLSMKKSWIRENPNGTVSVLHYKDKGSLSRVTTIYDKKHIKEILEIKNSAKGEKLFQAYKSDKTFMSNKTLQKRMSDKLRDVTEDMKTVETYKKKGSDIEFTKTSRIVLHSFRKNYANNKNEEYLKYLLSNPKKTEERMEEILKDLSVAEPKVMEKYEKAVEKQNKRNEQYSKEKGNENYKQVKHLSVREFSAFAISTHLGHFRSSISKENYLSAEKTDEIIAKYTKK